MNKENEQWISGGDCSKCRKQKYCGAKCNEYYRRRGEEISNFIKSKYSGHGLVSEIIGNAVGSAVKSQKWDFNS